MRPIIQNTADKIPAVRPCVQRTAKRQITRLRRKGYKLKRLELRASNTGPVLELIEKAKQSAPPGTAAREIARNSCTTPEAATRADKKAKPNRRAHWENVAADEEQETAALIWKLEALLSKHIVLPEHGALVVALWVMLTWTYNSFQTLPMLLIESPTKQCGKTTLLTLIGWLCRKTLLSSNMSSAALYRYIEKHEPTLIVDEADSFMRDDDGMRNLLNAGHTKAFAYTMRCIGEGANLEPVDFSTWCPKALASIGTLKGTITDRGFRITLHRRTRDQEIARRPMADTEEFQTMRSRLMRWAEDNADRLAAYHVQMPDALFNRLGDNWEPLLAIAGIAGGNLTDRAKGAALALSDAAEETDSKVELLEDVRKVFKLEGMDEIGAEQMVAELCKLPETHYADCNHGRAITTKRVAMMLKGFNLKTSREDGKARRWHRADFEPVWIKYLSKESA